jgi:AcrR family transcriptional regulator
MSVKTNSDRKAERRQATIDEVVAAAWGLASEQGLVGFSMRELGSRVGMRAQSLYSYFESKNDIYDAMFVDGNRAFLEWLEDDSEPVGAEDTIETARRQARRAFEFLVADPVRFQLLFQRTIPGFEPSSDAYSLAESAYVASLGAFRALGLSEADLDLATAVLAGLASQQLANDPGGDRWERLVDRATTMLLTELVPDRVTQSRRSE